MKKIKSETLKRNKEIKRMYVELRLQYTASQSIEILMVKYKYSFEYIKNIVSTKT